MSREPTTVYSQPANTGSGIHENTQLASAIDALKHHANPVRLEDFALSQGLPALLNPNSGLFARFKVHDRVMYDAKTDLWMYKPDYDLRTPADLVSLLKDRYLNPGNGAGNSSAAGMRLAELRESYPAARDAIEELSKAEPREDREVLVLRGQRDGAIKQVFWNPLRGKEAKGVDDEFKELWHELKVPDLVDLPKELEREGLTTTDMLDAPVSAAQLAANAKNKKKKKGSGPRRFKLQNTHLEGVDLSQDFVRPS
ncbi:transcription initiation factor IIE subunit beta [Moesziomyces antarcticus]|uniref:Transcription initiation factor IIE subunit beta n=1 Tax=Pseudozyma antarctica TaxID=84753 RepID=A0A5C3FGI4_PSEA2|nr:transcription initiation factor IIE subunit beta [Moesziomyces antarcticus]GAK63003.1 transcription initiation factor IIE subunit beta [Moesziomyces antarcticus]SPO43513.1 related to TFA2 - TFIIE small subunit [Moesziomyces antarcticus]